MTSRFTDFEFDPTLDADGMSAEAWEEQREMMEEDFGYDEGRRGLFMIQLPVSFDAAALMGDYFAFTASLVGVAFIVTCAFVVQRIMARL